VEDQEHDKYQGPYWRSNSSMFVVIKSLAEVHRLLGRLLKEERSAAPKLEEFYSRHPEDELSEEFFDEFADIMDRIWGVEAIIGWSSSTAILMSAIDLESTINRFCFFDLGETTTEAIESLPMWAKLEVAHRVMGLSEFKGSKAFQYVRELATWRNKFSHGKNTDMPIRTLRDNHLQEPKILPEVEQVIGELVKLVRGYIFVDRYLSNIARHPYGKGYSLDLDDAEEWVRLISLYRFRDGRIMGKAPERPRRRFHTSFALDV